MTPRAIKDFACRLLATLLLALPLVANATEEPPAVLDLQSCTTGSVGFSWGLGSFCFDLIGHDEIYCLFEYFSEVEGGFSLRMCKAPRELGTFVLDPETYRPWSGTGLEVDEAIAPHCKLLEAGNLLINWDTTKEDIHE